MTNETNIINVYAETTDYNELPTGWFEMSADEYIKANAEYITDVAQAGNVYTITAEWGNGEGADTYVIEVR